FSQEKPNFIHPMDLPLEVAGNFMELRSNHFHSGLDMKTGGQIGQPVKAVADGWISRIKISPWGYGKAVYIDHPSGYTTVYGHLDHLKGVFADAALEAQYKARDFSIDKEFAKGELPVNQGEVFAYSGNTGGSSGPHLHFEVRRTADQHAVDPQAFGMNPPDKVPPSLLGLRIYALDDSSKSIPYPTGTVGFPVVAVNDSTYMVKAGTKLSAFGTVGLALNITDNYSNSHNRCGVRWITVSVDGTQVYSAHLDDIDFAKQRYANAYMDYAMYTGRSLKYNRLYKLPNNTLNIYGKEAAQGRITVQPGKDHTVQVGATDAAGNRSMLTFVLHGATPAEATAWPNALTPGQLFKYKEANLLVQNGLRFSLPANALYDDERIRYALLQKPKGAVAPLHRIQDANTPLQIAGEISVTVQDSISEGLTSKLLIVRMVKGKPVAEGGTYANGAVTASVRNFGDFTVMLDTVAPALYNLDLKADMTGRKSFKLKIGDALSGIKSWEVRLDGKWIMMEYTPGSSTLEHTFDKYSSASGKHKLEASAVDERGNRSSFSFEFTR
ncbi:MAG: M23 family metallopeptidase, partial [Flavobacteriales bacterium]